LIYIPEGPEKSLGDNQGNERKKERKTNVVD